MMPELFIHPTSQRQLASLAADLPQSLLLHGPEGVGLDTIARAFAEQAARPGGVVETISPEKTGITIEQIRELYISTRSRASMRRVFLLSAADQMATAAQNAFLKLLEEPTASAHFILLSHQPQAILPTILSRLQTVELLPFARSQAVITATASQLEPVTQQQILFIAEGLPAELIRLSRDEVYRTQRFAAATQAKQLLAGSLSDKLAAVNTLVASRTGSQAALSILGRMLQRQIEKQPSDRTLLAKLDHLLDTQVALASNGNLKVQLLRLILD